MLTNETELRVRYPECDPMGIAHHGTYATWFEIGRSDLLRQTGVSYRNLEEAGEFLPIVDVYIRYKKPARYDDVLRLVSKMTYVSKAKIIFEYELYRDGIMLATGKTTNACINAQGKLQSVPKIILASFEADQALNT